MLRLGAMIGLSVFCLVAVATDGAWAQVPRFTPRGANAALATRDFVVNRPTVSPYLNLLRLESSVSQPNYQALVRPALESRQRRAQQRTEMRRMQGQVANMQGQLAARSNRQDGFVTGHPSRFATYLHYYPQLNRR